MQHPVICMEIHHFFHTHFDWSCLSIHSPFKILEIWSTRLNSGQYRFYSDNADNLKNKYEIRLKFLLHNSEYLRIFTRNKNNFLDILLTKLPNQTQLKKKKFEYTSRCTLHTDLLWSLATNVFAKLNLWCQRIFLSKPIEMFVTSAWRSCAFNGGGI